MHTEKVVYQDGDLSLSGYFAWREEEKKKRPAVIVVHAWKGQDSFARDKAEALAALGYVGFACDMYGDGVEVVTNEEAAARMMPLFIDRKSVRRRMQSAFECVSRHPCVDQSKIAVIGYCFGGLCALELFKSGCPVRGAVTFHAVLGNKMGDAVANEAPIADAITGSLLMLHGHDDPLVSADDIARTQKELTEKKIDWQMHIYSNTSHAFTNPEAHDASMGLFYNPLSNARSWQAMRNFLDDQFTK